MFPALFQFFSTHAVQFLALPLFLPFPPHSFFYPQDQPHVIQNARARGLPADIEIQGTFFFKHNPVKGARAWTYHFRRIFHDWSDQASVDILRNTVQTMNSNGRILISMMHSQAMVRTEPRSYKT